MNQRLQENALANIKNANAFRRIGFMASQRQQIHAKLINVHRDLAYRLRCVGVEEDVALMRNTSNFGDGLKSPDLIVGMHHRNKHGPRRQCTPDIVGIDLAEAIHRQVGYRCSLSFKKAARVENRRVFDLSSDNVSVPPALGEERTLQRMIIGFASAAGEYDLVRTALQ